MYAVMVNLFGRYCYVVNDNGIETFDNREDAEKAASIWNADAVKVVEYNSED